MNTRLLFSLTFFSLTFSLRALPEGEELAQYLEGQTFVLEAAPIDGVKPTAKYQSQEIQFLQFLKGNLIVQWTGNLGRQETQYTVKGNKILMSIFRTDRAQPCELRENSKSAVFKVELKCGNMKFYQENTRRPEGTEMQIDGVEVIVMTQKSGELTTPAVFRRVPATNGMPIRCNGLLPISSGFSIMARTKSKVKIGKWNNYWYYVQAGLEFQLSPCDSQNGWVFGEFVKIK